VCTCSWRDGSFSLFPLIKMKPLRSSHASPGRPITRWMNLPAFVDSFEKGFVRSLMANGMSHATAVSKFKCLIGYAQRHWTQEEFVRHGQAHDAEGRAAAATCGGF
jgi:hypothetical protein